MAHSFLGDYSYVGQHSTIYSGVMIGQHAHVMENVRLNSGVILQDDVFCGPSVTVSSPSRLRGKLAHQVVRVSPTLIKRHANLGANSSIAAGVTIGHSAFVEANSVVDRSVPNFAVVSGSPLNIIGWRCHCEEWLTFASTKTNQTECNHCGLMYQQTSDTHIDCIDGSSTDGSVSQTPRLHIPRKQA
jgi:UDP-2-acetamido-3-amino-2,3-dideoxy-glucuronate N-acetyltransferase